ncbi:RNA-binding protein 26 [Nymphon striatum]|nr:RNA-binding protein 26 [Nymphon striatum]
MQIENQELLKIWLTASLEPLCGADPAALAKYVIALVKKDKTEDELRNVCLEQLDVFLQKETKPFVAMLFEVLKDKSYLKAAANNNISKNIEVKKLAVPSVEPLTAAISKSAQNNQVFSSHKPVSKEDPVKPHESISDKEHKGRKSRSSSPHVRSRSRSRSHSPQHGHRSRSKDERHFRSRHDEDNRRRNRIRRYDNKGYSEFRRDRDKDIKNKNRSWSKSRSRSRSRSKSKSPVTKDFKKEGDSISHRDVDYRVPPISKASDHCDASIKVNKDKPRINGRCHDYDEKGFCMRGDLCPYDHGADPVVVEDVNLQNVLGFHPTGPLRGTPAPPSASNSQSIHPRQPLIPGVAPNPPPVDTSIPPPRPLPEPYNPEAPGIDRPLRMPAPFWSTAPPPSLSNAVTVSRNSRPRGNAPYMLQAQQPQRTLIGIPVVENVQDNTQPKINIDKVVVNSQVTVPGQSEINENNSSVVSIKQNTQGGCKKKGNFPYNRLGKRKFNQNIDNCVLELRKIPSGLNTITQLNKHFEKFGNIVNLQICFEGDPEAALITFSSNAEAHAAYRSTEAVLNNRFIKVFWHNKENTSKTNEVKDSSLKLPIKDRLGPSKGALVNNNGSELNAPSKTQEKAVVFSSGGNLARTVINTSALKKSNTVTQNNSLTEANKKKVLEQRKENLKKKADLQKRKQDLLENQIQQQKLLIEKIEKNKSLPAKEKMSIMITIKALSTHIEATKEQISESQKQVFPSTNVKSKQEAQKDILDAELEIYNRQHSGTDTTELHRKVAELKHEREKQPNSESKGEGKEKGEKENEERKNENLKAVSLGLIGRGGKAFRGSRAPRGRGNMTWGNRVNRTNVDHRPKKLLVRTINGNIPDKMELINHFAKLVQVEDCISGKNGIIMSFKTRKDAESAATYGTKFKDRTLHLTWYKEPYSEFHKKLNENDLLLDTEDVENQDEDEAFMDNGDDILGDDDEEEDSEARSWRR